MIVTHCLKLIIVLLLSFSIHFSDAFFYCYNQFHDGKRVFVDIKQLQQHLQRQSSWKHCPLLSRILLQSSLLMIKKKNGFSGGGIGFGTKNQKDIIDNKNGVGNVMQPTAAIETTTINQKLTTTTKTHASIETTDSLPILDQ